MLFNLDKKAQALKMVAGLSKWMKNPDALDNARAVAGSLRGTNLFAQSMAHLLNHPSFKALADERWRPPVNSLKELSLLPTGSLGKTYADELIKQGFSPDELMDSGEVTNLKSFVSHRLHETHDIIHVLTGFGTDLVGEMGLQAFALAQNRAPLAVLLISGSLRRALQNDEPLEPLLLAISRGFEMGLNADLVIAYKLEEQWGVSVEEWRKTLGFKNNAWD